MGKKKFITLSRNNLENVTGGWYGDFFSWYFSDEEKEQLKINGVKISYTDDCVNLAYADGSPMYYFDDIDKAFIEKILGKEYNMWKK